MATRTASTICSVVKFAAGAALTDDGKVDLVVSSWRVFIVHAAPIDALILKEKSFDATVQTNVPA